MQELIKIEQKEGIETVNARDLHEYLESKQEFSTWIKNRIEKYNFVENKDFLIILSESTGGRPANDYYISINMAKQLSMVENNDKGDKARTYFINCEEQLGNIVKQVNEKNIYDTSIEMKDLYQKLNLMSKEIRSLKRMLSENTKPQTLDEIKSFFNVVDYSKKQQYIVVEYDNTLFSITYQNNFTIMIKYKTENGVWDNNWNFVKNQVGSIKKGLEYILEMY